MRKQTEKPKVSPTMCKRKEELCGLLFAIDSLRKLVIFFRYFRGNILYYFIREDTCRDCGLQRGV